MISSIFDEKPLQWGGRGDPYLWEELRLQFKEVDLPNTEEEFRSIFKAKYMEITNVSLDDDDNVFIERFSHGGMSSGVISYEFWREIAFPLLIERYNFIKSLG